LHIGANVRRRTDEDAHSAYNAYNAQVGGMPVGCGNSRSALRYPQRSPALFSLDLAKR